jgi:hypothetical protein
LDIARQRLHNQGLNVPRFNGATQAVEWFGAVQAQDFQAAKWALGQRVLDATDADIEREFNKGSILRTHIMRPTWHLVTPADIRWLLRLTAPRIKARSRSYFRQLDLDEALFKRSHKALLKALKAHQYLDKRSLKKVIERAGISVPVPLRLTYILFEAELEGLICSGPRRGKQLTYALLEERIPETKELPREAALAELARRYFTSHGPATLQDFSWWSGLTVTEAKAGVAFNGKNLEQESIGDKSYWFSRSQAKSKGRAPLVCLLPPYDEYLVAYKDRSAAMNGVSTEQFRSRNPIFDSPLVLNGRVIGGWKRAIKNGSLIITVLAVTSLSTIEKKAIEKAANRYAAFLGVRRLEFNLQILG